MDKKLIQSFYAEWIVILLIRNISIPRIAEILGLPVKFVKTCSREFSFLPEYAEKTRLKYLRKKKEKKSKRKYHYKKKKTGTAASEM